MEDKKIHIFYKWNKSDVVLALYFENSYNDMVISLIAKPPIGQRKINNSFEGGYLRPTKRHHTW